MPISLYQMNTDTFAEEIGESPHSVAEAERAPLEIPRQFESVLPRKTALPIRVWIWTKIRNV